VEVVEENQPRKYWKEEMCAGRKEVRKYFRNIKWDKI
jgi:hypothetical protein